MPDATGLELIAQAVRERLGDETVVGTAFAHGEATLEIAPASIRDVLRTLRDADEPWDRLSSLHGNDYFPEEPRFGVHYYLLSMERADRLHVKLRVGADDARIASVVDMFAGADFQEREVYDMFGVEFDGHPDMRRILMPEDYEGFPQRRDFPMGGEPVIFTFNEHKLPRWYE
ncbi:MAG: NADH-quinone oxidoreductase subunit C [Thermoleophilaceae bacterium]